MFDSLKLFSLQYKKYKEVSHSGSENIKFLESN